MLNRRTFLASAPALAAFVPRDANRPEVDSELATVARTLFQDVDHLCDLEELDDRVDDAARARFQAEVWTPAYDRARDTERKLRALMQSRRVSGVVVGGRIVINLIDCVTPQSEMVPEELVIIETADIMGRVEGETPGHNEGRR